MGISPDGIGLDLEYDLYYYPWYNPHRWLYGSYGYYPKRKHYWKKDLYNKWNNYSKKIDKNKYKNTKYSNNTKYQKNKKLPIKHNSKSIKINKGTLLGSSAKL